MQRSQDLGTIIEGDKATVTWTLENRGTADLVIDRTTSSCGCTVVQLAENEKIIPPGGSLALKADFDSTNRRESQVKTVGVYSNDSVEPELHLDFKAKVELLYELDPAGVLNLRAIRRGATGPKGLDILPGPGRTKLTIHSIEIQDDAPLNFQSEPLETRGKAGQRVYFTVSESASMGSLNAHARIRLSVDGIDRERTFPIRGEVVADLIWLPKVIDATRQPSLPGKRLVPVTISSTEKTPFDVVSASAGPLFEVSVEPGKGLTPRTEYVVSLSLREDAPPGPFGTMLDIRTTSLDQPLVSIPAFGIVAAAVEIEPPMVLLRDDGTANGVRRRVKIQASTTTALEITEVTCDQPVVSVAVDWKASKRYRHIRFLDVSLSGKLPPGVYQTALRLVTNMGEGERLEIPVTIEIGSGKP